jgi:hypothetical protein
MHTKRLIRAALTLALVGAAASAMALQDKPDKAMPRGGGDDPMMAKWMEYATPGPAHKVLDPRIGKWSVKVKCYETPGGPSEESTGTAEMKWVKDGRFVEEQARGTFKGMPFEGSGLIGYDNLKKKYVGSWTDNLSTGIMACETTYDPSSRTFTGTMECPDVMAGKYVRGRSVEKWTDNDHFTCQAFGPGPDGKEFMKSEIAYTRQK